MNGPPTRCTHTGTNDARAAFERPRAPKGWRLRQQIGCPSFVGASALPPPPPLVWGARAIGPPRARSSRGSSLGPRFAKPRWGSPGSALRPVHADCSSPHPPPPSAMAPRPRGLRSVPLGGPLAAPLRGPGGASPLSLGPPPLRSGGPPAGGLRAAAGLRWGAHGALVCLSGPCCPPPALRAGGAPAPPPRPSGRPLRGHTWLRRDSLVVVWWSNGR